MAKYDVIVVGGGAMGLSVAYNLLRKGKKVHVLEGDYLNAGSTGRNLGVLKARNPYAIGNGNKDLVKLAKMGLKLNAGLSSETGINTFHKTSGCLILAKDEADLKQLKEYHAHFKSMGLDERELSPAEIHRKWNYIDPDSIISGFYSPSEANAHPFGVVWAYVEAIRKRKAQVEKQNRVSKIEKTSDGYKVTAEKGEYDATEVVVACAERSSELTEQLGHKVPLKPMRKEVLISEPIRPFLGPSLERLSTHFQATQTMRGEIMGTIDWMDPGYDLGESSSEFLEHFADEMVPVIPVLSNLNIIRQWTGICDQTPDDKPAVGKLDEGLYVTCGYNDYGITMAPAVGRLLAKTIINDETDPMLKPFDPLRFK
ncbi:FAD-binding oxidoreductase [Candidatus Bathyarchaeota archaeon]|jgi:sarcosine oxidase, subunit beta|nr:FAD-binding oxidoreductase [Candidatus Bathyarchaeota archaeon]MBT4319038.1 FAD-binding oxidoreductase [Candidatus Bathyarchaeota archaeon]MBT4423328.1 FAD-binding oxidoreductase [Candidatus Bathyarchaeota archaeon]MBT6603804.1 FAD-binding oxidoreductase [Candidatus Bathyarchaeota archaeon]MBT7185847.1 FAD-binding oxidoreductase [Candidatus Bathyarchaeota archaeon]